MDEAFRFSIGSALEFATAAVKQTARGENQIVVYVLPRQSSVPANIQEVQEYWLQNLPEYMVPSVFFAVAAGHLLSNGKIDHSLLPAPSEDNLLERLVSKESSKPTEKKLLDVIRDVLNQPAVTVEDNFFLAGGHSLLGMQLVMRLRNTFEVDVTLRQLFESPTKRLALLIDINLSERRLIAIWMDLLKQQQIRPDTGFFELGGDAQTVNALQPRISEDFGKQLTIVELHENPTVSKQVMLICCIDDATALPPRVLPLRTHSSQNPIFLVHHLSTNQVRAMADDQAFINVGLTTEEVQSLGLAPPLEEIVACFVPKILATQPADHKSLETTASVESSSMRYDLNCELWTPDLSACLAGYSMSLVF